MNLLMFFLIQFYPTIQFLYIMIVGLNASMHR